MRVEATRLQGWLWVDWWIHNHCAWRCSYCPELLRTGSIPLPSLIDCQRFVDELVARAQSLGVKPRIKFTGGEPTEWTSLDDLLSYAHGQGVTISLRTNANVAYDRWLDICPNLEDLELNYHPEHAQASVYMLNLARALEHDINVRCVFNMLPTRFEETEELLTRIRGKYPSVSVERRMLFQDPAVNHRPMQYTESQQVKLIRQSGDIRVTQGSMVSYTDYPTMVSDGSNRFQDYDCKIGLEQLIVDAWGRVRRGHCGQGGSIGTIGGPIIWPTLPLKCRRPTCDNAFDILATKISG
jgi:organic radical activating enzyme